MSCDLFWLLLCGHINHGTARGKQQIQWIPQIYDHPATGLHRLVLSFEIPMNLVARISRHVINISFLNLITTRTHFDESAPHTVCMCVYIKRKIYERHGWKISENRSSYTYYIIRMISDSPLYGYRSTHEYDHCSLECWYDLEWILIWCGSN